MSHSSNVIVADVGCSHTSYVSRRIPTQCYDESFDITSICETVLKPGYPEVMSFTQWKNLNLVSKFDSSKFKVRLNVCDGKIEDLFIMKAAEPDTGSKVHTYLRNLRSNEDKKRVNFTSPKMLNMIKLHKTFSVSGKLYDKSSNFRICCSYLKILGKSDGIYLVYLDKVNVIYKKVSLISILQSHYNCDIPVFRLQPPTDPNCYEAHINVLFKCFGEKASQHESQVLLLTNRNVKCAYSYCEWNERWKNHQLYYYPYRSISYKRFLQPLCIPTHPLYFHMMKA